ncbi:hypothetical protein [Streptomyces sp. NPDC059479]|uniref:hypothetical protein n=1 Tax=Streptomyces sp. NPDC059479 TaxID=3346848 RepID=UPI0036C30B22
MTAGLPEGGEFPLRSGIEFPACRCPMCVHRPPEPTDDSPAMARLMPRLQQDTAQRHREIDILGRRL